MQCIIYLEANSHSYRNHTIATCQRAENDDALFTADRMPCVHFIYLLLSHYTLVVRRCRELKEVEKESMLKGVRNVLDTGVCAACVNPICAFSSDMRAACRACPMRMTQACVRRVRVTDRQRAVHARTRSCIRATGTAAAAAAVAAIRHDEGGACCAVVAVAAPLQLTYYFTGCRLLIILWHVNAICMNPVRVAVVSVVWVR